ncbi:hypothetical protein CASFOL_037831 [Castilleja foliolosa]|uniref:RING-type domain-containing protein n=1 Tax=Castilleja foliolosa TaxID=1961234 RepID=A0ABD3BJB4_9LAMI
MDRADQPSTGGGGFSGDASASASWENYEETPPLPFPERSTEFSRNYSRGERFAGMNNEDYLMSNEGPSAVRDDPKSCFIASTTFSFFGETEGVYLGFPNFLFLIAVAMTMAFGLYASETLKLGPNSSILIKPNHLFVESIKVVALDAAKGSIMYGFYKDPPLDVKVTWSETHRITLPSRTHKEWVYYLNKGSQINISYSVSSRRSSPIVLVIAEGNTGLAEWLKEPSYPNIAASWNIIHGNGLIQKDISESSIYYIAVGNLNDEFAEVHLNSTIHSFLYNTSESYYKCAPAEGQCTFQLFLSGGNTAVLTSPGHFPGIVSDDRHVKVSYAPRWLIYLLGIGGITSLLLLFNYVMSNFKRTEQDVHGDQRGDGVSERNSLLSHKDDDNHSWGSSYASVSDDEDHIEDKQAGRLAKDDENKQLCAICFDAPKNCFFIPCGHCVACFGCATRIVESSGVCPICRRHTKKVRKIYTV